MTGSTMCLAVPQPVVGKIGQTTLNTYCKKDAVTKVGIVVPNSARTMITLSEKRLRLSAAMMPRMVPTTKPIASAMPPTCAETGAKEAAISATVLPG